MYTVKYNIYANNEEEVFTYNSWSEALNGYQIVSNNVIKPNWTRHNSVQSEISHMNFKSNIFNEGSVILSPVK